MTRAISLHQCDGYKMPSPGLLASLARYESPTSRYLYTVRDDDTANGAAGDTDVEDDGVSEPSEAHDKAENAPAFSLEACGDLKWFPEFKSLFGTE